MKRIVFGECVQGASHIRVQKECQDSMKRVELDDNSAILAVADGHGSDSCPFSKSGSSIAVNVFCKIISELYFGYKDNPEMLMTYLNREGETKIAQAIDNEWKRRVLATHTKHKREVAVIDNGEKDRLGVYKQYGTTLVGLLVTPMFVFAFQIGDGDITYVDRDGVNTVLLTEKILGTETHSLSKKDAWKKAVSVVHRKDISERLPSMFMLSTDGFSNSYVNESEFKKTCLGYFEMIGQYGAKAVKSSLGSWLSETSEQGCGDDITVLIAYFCEKKNQETSVSDDSETKEDNSAVECNSNESEDKLDGEGE